MKQNKTVNDVLKRGYAEKHEMDALEKDIGFSRFWTEDKEERFWGILLTEERFILANHPLEFFGSPPVIGLVGVHNKGIMDTDKSINEFKKVSDKYSEYLEVNP